MKADELRKSILQLAIRGKLVKQNPDDEPASVLIEKIREEKKRLVKEGKIKKEKTESVIYKGADNSYYEKIGAETRCIDGEIPFEMPDGWEWVRLKDISEVYLGKTLDKQKNKGDYKTYLRSVNIRWGSVDLDDIKEMKFEQSELEKYELQIGDLLICEGGEVGRCAIWDKNISMRFQNAIHRARFHKEINPYFYMYVIWHYNDILLLKDISRGVTIQHLTGQALDSLFFPLPPITEQHRIVLHIEELMFQIDKYDKTEQRLVAFDTNFPDTLKKSILQSAIQGKLVAQDPDDEPASVLLEKIRKERETLTKSYIYKNTEDNSYYELRNDKVLCIDDEIPFEIPDNWAWCRLYSITNYIQRGKSPIYSDIQQYPVIAQKCIQWTGISLEKALFIEPQTISKYLPERFIQEGDILINSTGTGTLGRIGYFTDKIRGQYNTIVADSHVTVVRCSNLISAKYISLFFSSPFVQNEIENKADGSTNQIELNTESIKSYIIPLPPINEQKRIIE
jgi:type I restriction enzyme S subunit